MGSTEPFRIPQGALERLAKIEHERWSHWQTYLHKSCSPLPDGSLVIPAKLAQRWQRQCETPYHQLSEDEKPSDRDQVARYINEIVEILAELPKSDKMPS